MIVFLHRFSPMSVCSFLNFYLLNLPLVVSWFVGGNGEWVTGTFTVASRERFSHPLGPHPRSQSWLVLADDRWDKTRDVFYGGRK